MFKINLQSQITQSLSVTAIVRMFIFFREYVVVLYELWNPLHEKDIGHHPLFLKLKQLAESGQNK